MQTWIRDSNRQMYICNFVCIYFYTFANSNLWIWIPRFFCKFEYSMWICKFKFVSSNSQIKIPDFFIFLLLRKFEFANLNSWFQIHLFQICFFAIFILRFWVHYLFIFLNLWSTVQRGCDEVSFLLSIVRTELQSRQKWMQCLVYTLQLANTFVLRQVCQHALYWYGTLLW